MLLISQIIHQYLSPELKLGFFFFLIATFSKTKFKFCQYASAEKKNEEQEGRIYLLLYPKH